VVADDPHGRGRVYTFVVESETPQPHADLREPTEFGRSGTDGRGDIAVSLTGLQGGTRHRLHLAHLSVRDVEAGALRMVRNGPFGER
jgi:hypothetical protein